MKREQLSPRYTTAARRAACG
ncbi:DUF4113 domain-containing protein [Aeromonas dhakensis]|nr:DUF4113 domain-containing protein [Aeromonas dhakensis]